MPPPREPEGLDADLPRAFGRLTLLKQIARGGMGEVYLATSGGIEGAERPCVVKIIRRDHDDDRSFLARFLDEARIQSQLQHPGVAQILEASTDDSGKPYVVLEYVEGRNLGEVRHRTAQLGTRVPWPDVVAIGVALMEALAHVHERTDAGGRPLHIVHRDLSPQNVMLAYSGEAKLIDFGTARGSNRRCQTVAGIVFAKPGYVAPEVANNRPGGAPADLYAAGIMLWELLNGTRFLTGDAAQHLALVASGERRPSLVAEQAGAPQELDTVLAKLTAYDVEQRYESARHALADLVALLKRAPSLADGERSVRARVAQLLTRLYPSEPARSRTEFARLLAAARQRRATEAPPARSLENPGDTEAAGPDVLPGTRYRLLRVLGSGGIGVVHEAVHLDLGRSVALKVLSPDRACTSEVQERFRAEARAIGQLCHENLVRLYDYGVTAGGSPYYAMELLEGETLEQRLDREQVIEWGEAARLAIQACRALEVAHAAGILHRDIKPANLFITRDGTLKLLDFGLANSGLEPQASDEGALIVLGTPEYMSPEQACGDFVDERCDLYALGCVLYELVTGTLPFEVSSTVALLDAKNRKTPESPRERAPKRGVPPMLEKIIQRAIERDPERRYTNAVEMREALANALSEPVRKRALRRRVGIAALVLCSLSLVSAVAYGATHPEIIAHAKAVVTPGVEALARFGKPAPAAQAASPAAQAVAAAPAAPEAAGPAAVAQQGEEVDDEVDQADDGAADLGPEGESEEDPSAQQVAAAEGGEGADEEGEAAGEGEAANEATAPAAAQKTASAEPAGDEIDQKIQDAQALITGGKRVKGFNELRRLGRNNRKDVRVLRAWCDAASQMGAWGESYRVARQWAAVDSGLEAQLTLARMQKAVGKRNDAIASLRKIIDQNPESEEAKEMMRLLTPPKARLAQR